MKRLFGVLLALVLPAVSSSQSTRSTTACSETPTSVTECSITINVVCGCGETPAPPPFGNHATLTNGLISYWKMDEASGTRRDSVVATGNHLSDNNTVGSTAAKIGLGASFIAANTESLTRADSATTVWGEDGNGVTVTMWVKVTGASGYGMLFGRQSGNRPFQIFSETGDINKWYYDVTTSGGLTTAVITGFNNTTIADGGTHFLAFWFDPVDKKFHADLDNGAVTFAGAAQVSGTLVGATGSVSFGNWTIGSLTYVADEAGVWGRVLTSQERTDLYNGGAGLTY